MSATQWHPVSPPAVNSPSYTTPTPPFSVAQPFSAGPPLVDLPPYTLPPPPLPGTARRADNQALIGWMKAISFGVFALCTAGHASSVIVGAYGVRRRSTLNIVAAVIYGLATLTFWVVVVLMPTEYTEVDSPWTMWDWMLLPGIFVSPLVGSAHAFALGVSDINRAKNVDETAQLTGRMDRERALQIVTYHPYMARELRIGRPDLPRWYNDGGLIDVNAVPDYVLAQVPGMTHDQAGRIVADRGMRGPYASVFDLTYRHPDLRSNVAALHRFVVLTVPSGSTT